MTLRHRPTGRNNCRLRFESLEDRSLMTAGPTPAQAIQLLNAQALAVNQQTAGLTNSIQANQNGLMGVVRQLDSTNFQAIQTATQHGQTQVAVADMNQRTVITAAETRITSEFTQTLAPLTAANKTFQSLTTQLVTEVRYGVIAPAAALAAQNFALGFYDFAAETASLQSIGESQFELANVSQLTNSVEGLQGLQNLGTFHGNFDIESPVGGLLKDFQGVATTHLTVSANMLQGTFSGLPGDYLQTLTGPSIGPTKVVNQPITGGTLTATISQASDAQGYTVHGTVTLQLGPIANVPAQFETYQIAGNLTGNHFLVGQIMLNGVSVGKFDWGVM